MPSCCITRSSFKPRVCVRDLSQVTQRFLRLHCSADGIVAAQESLDHHLEHQEKFDQLATLQAKHGVRLNMELTSKLYFSSAAGVLDFLKADCTQTVNTQQRYHQTFLTGHSASCVNQSRPLKE